MTNISEHPQTVPQRHNNIMSTYVRTPRRTLSRRGVLETDYNSRGRTFVMAVFSHIGFTIVHTMSVE